MGQLYVCKGKGLECRWKGVKHEFIILLIISSFVYYQKMTDIKYLLVILDIIYFQSDIINYK